MQPNRIKQLLTNLKMRRGKSACQRSPQKMTNRPIEIPSVQTQLISSEETVLSERVLNLTPGPSSVRYMMRTTGFKKVVKSRNNDGSNTYFDTTGVQTLTHDKSKRSTSSTWSSPKSQLRDAIKSNRMIPYSDLAQFKPNMVTIKK